MQNYYHHGNCYFRNNNYNHNYIVNHNLFIAIIVVVVDVLVAVAVVLMSYLRIREFEIAFHDFEPLQNKFYLLVHMYVRHPSDKCQLLNMQGKLSRKNLSICAVHTSK